MRMHTDALETMAANNKTKNQAAAIAASSSARDDNADSLAAAGLYNLHGHSHGGTHGHSHGGPPGSGGHGHAHGFIKVADTKRLMERARPECGTLVVAFLALLGSAGVNLVLPYALGEIIQPTSWWGSSIRDKCLIAGGVFIAGAILSFVRGWLFGLAGERIVMKLREDLFASIMAQEMGFFHSTRTGELVNRLSADCTLVQIATTVTFAMLWRFSLQVVGGLAILFAIAPILTLVMLAPIPILATGSFFYGGFVKRLSGRIQTALAATTAVADESISMIQFVKTFAGEPREIEKFHAKAHDSFILGKRMAWAFGVFQALVEFASYVCILLVIWYGALLIDRGELDAARLLSYLLYTVYAAHAIGATANTASSFAQAVGSSARVFQIIDRHPEMHSGTKKVEHATGAIEVKSLNFTYATRSDIPVLRDISLSITPGRMLALVGPSGSGKTTLASLLMRLYDPENPSSVTFDGIPLVDLDLPWLRSQIGFVPQEPILLATSITENIRYGKPDATQAEIEQAAREAYCYDFIANDIGWDAQAGERGARLSGGQKQRISLARALLKRPKVLILDEATSQLDSNNEALIGEAIMNIVRSGVAVLVIAHRLATIERAHSVAYMEQGRITEQGTHTELMNLEGGRYRQLVAIGLGSTSRSSPSHHDHHTYDADYSHGHSHGGSDHGHSHGGGDHGHSHGGNDHGHSHGVGGHAHSHGGMETGADDDLPDLMDADSVDIKIHGASSSTVPPQPREGAAVAVGPAPTPAPLPSISVAVHIPTDRNQPSSSS